VITYVIKGIPTKRDYRKQIRLFRIENYKVVAKLLKYGIYIRARLSTVLTTLIYRLPSSILDAPNIHLGGNITGGKFKLT